MYCKRPIIKLVESSGQRTTSWPQSSQRPADREDLEGCRRRRRWIERAAAAHRRAPLSLSSRRRRRWSTASHSEEMTNPRPRQRGHTSFSAILALPERNRRNLRERGEGEGERERERERETLRVLSVAASSAARSAWKSASSEKALPSSSAT